MYELGNAYMIEKYLLIGSTYLLTRDGSTKNGYHNTKKKWEKPNKIS